MLDSILSKNGHYFALDFGMKRIGTAIGQLSTRTTAPLEVIPAKDGIPYWEKLDTLIATWQPLALIIGVPFDMNDQCQELTYCARKFSKRLQSRYHLIVEEMDERLTTRAARERIVHVQGSHALKKTNVDCVAAQIILESWMNMQKEEK